MNFRNWDRNSRALLKKWDSYFFADIERFLQDKSEREIEGNYLPLLLREIDSLQEELLRIDAQEGEIVE